MNVRDCVSACGEVGTVDVGRLAALHIYFYFLRLFSVNLNFISTFKFEVEETCV